MKSHNHLVDIAFEGVSPEKKGEYEIYLKYSGKFKPYNANIRYTGKKIWFNLSKKWSEVGDEIQIGLLQSLIIKVFKIKKTTIEIELYNSFMKNLHIAAPKTESDPILDESFNRVNEKYFFGLVEKPNLKWGFQSFRKLGSYEYGSDTITLSSILRSEELLMDYVMYHELLHKKHKFHNVNGRNYHHTREFQKKEKEFEESGTAELKIRKLAGKCQRKSIFNSFF